MTSEAAVQQLMAARRMRASGDTDKCLEFAQAAYTIALQSSDGETAWQARTCIGRMHFWRAEWEEAYARYKDALRTARGWRLPNRVLGSQHDCWLTASYGGWDASPHVVFRVEENPRGDDRLWAFTQDVYMLWMDGSVSRAEFLRVAALSSSWYAAEALKSEGWWPQYNAMFERMIIHAQLVHATGVLVKHGRLDGSYLTQDRNLFQMAVEELGTEEGYAVSLQDMSRGLEAAGLWDDAEEALRRSVRVAERRSEGKVVEEGITRLVALEGMRREL